jgi:hypothetical protein
MSGDLVQPSVIGGATSETKHGYYSGNARSAVTNESLSKPASQKSRDMPLNRRCRFKLRESPLELQRRSTDGYAIVLGLLESVYS